LDEPFPPPDFPLIQLLAYFDEEYENMVPGEVTPSTGDGPAEAVPPSVADTPSDAPDASKQEATPPTTEVPENDASVVEPNTDTESSPLDIGRDKRGV
jgi:hypothetical protein